MYPNKVKERKTIDLKLRIKSSLPKGLQMIALLYLLWKSNNKKSEIIYGEEINIAGNIGLKLKNELLLKLKEYLSQQNIICSENFEEIVNDNPLLTLQYEPLLVGLELVWKLCKIEFVDHQKSSQVERTGGNRYSKILKYTKNIEIIYHFLKDIDDLDKIFYEFLIDNRANLNKENEKHLKISYALTFITEDAKYLIVDEESNEIIFENIGIYEQLLLGNNVKINSSTEVKGSTRILYSLLDQNMNVYLEYNKSEKLIKLSSVSDTEILNFSDYYDLIENYKEITNDIKIIFINSRENTQNVVKKFELQKIVYGAPGTGKSYSLNKEVERLFGANKERVTFYDGYTYGQFVGMYKPVITENGDISYKYIPGSFMKQLVNSYKDPSNNFCLIIEEINRAKADKVFGNIFQLLDRDENGNSRYPISVSEEQVQYLKEELKDKKDILNRIENKGLYLPNNFYIWATMNSADDGVQPLDTAFKRRWKFNYISLNAKEDNFGNDGETFIIGKYKENNILWNNFRKILNDKLKVNITEDRLIAPFFISPNDFEEIDTNIKKIDKNILSEKVLMYIFDDLLRHYPKLRKEIFHNDVKTFSDIHEKVTKNDNFLKLIFNEGFLNQILGSDGIDGKK